MELKTLAVVSIILTLHGCNGQTRPADADNDPRPKTIFGYPVDRAYRTENRGPQRFAPVTEETSREQQYFNEQDSQQQRADPEQPAQQPLFTPQQQQAVLQQFYQQQQLQQQQASLQQYYQGLAQLQEQRQQLQQQQDQQTLQGQAPSPYRAQSQQLRPTLKQPLQQQRDAANPITSSISLLGVRYSAAPSVAHTMFKTNTGVSFSY